MSRRRKDAAKKRRTREHVIADLALNYVERSEEIEMPERITYGQLRHVLTELGFHEKRRRQGVALEHRPSDTLFLFRSYEADDRLQPGELFFVTKQLDERGLLEPDSFKMLLTKAPA